MHISWLPRRVAILIFSMALAAGGRCAIAAPIFAVVGQGGEGFFNASSSSYLSRASMLEGSFTDTNTGHISAGAINAFAAAGPGVLNVDANTSVYTNYSYLGTPGDTVSTNEATASSSMTLDDMVITGPAGMVSTSFGIHVSGILEASKAAEATSVYSGGSATVLVQLVGPNLYTEGIATQKSGQQQTSIGLLQNFTGNNNVISDVFAVTANQPFSIKIILGVDATSTLDGTDSGLVLAAAHFSNTLSFVTDGPVFSLPEGYTANSISGNIVDNRFVPAVVPLPAGIWLLGTAFAALGGRLRQRGRVAIRTIATGHSISGQQP